MAYWGVSAQQGSLAFGGVTATTPGTANTLVTLLSDRRVLVITNSLDQPVMITYNGAAFVELQAANGLVLDAGSNALTLQKDGVFGVYHLGVAPTVGRVSVSVL